ncbi:MAG: hypothetical protein C0410_07280 [Anaerolinea sp.]|nr:hypothetical protein [Anaerolinea sp.]
MNISSLTSFESIPYFTIEAVKQLLGDEYISAGSVRTALYRWMKTGHIIQLKKGVYMTRFFYEMHKTDMDFSLAISSILIPQSYNSLESILQRYGILTEITFPITSITLKHTRVINNKFGTFNYRNLKENLYTGFEISQYLGIPFAKATLSKALFDYLYLHTINGKERYSNYNLAEDYRLNLEDFNESDQSEFAKYVETSKSLKMSRILSNLRKTIWRP